MGFFDFLKRAELEEIRSLKEEARDSLSKIEKLNDRISELEATNTRLEPYLAIDDIEQEKRKKSDELHRLQQEYNSRITELKSSINLLEEQKQENIEKVHSLQREISIYNQEVDLADYGLYTPHFAYDTSDTYKAQIIEIRERQKTLIKNGGAAIGGENISWGNSLAQGQAMITRIKKLMIRAFNGESDYLISTVEWNNIDRYKERIEKAFSTINKTLDRQGVMLSYSYKDLKIAELILAYEYQVKKHEEREQQRVIREQMREEERALREIEQAKAKAEKEERMYLQMLEKARKEMGEAVGEKQAELLARISELEAGLVDAERLKQKAISMAQQTKMGYVYVISNIGSFGEDVFKIGMTRRLEPMDRVRELGDASVPFAFDVHAMIFSENAPELETQLHKSFANHRVNLVNDKREFFRIPLNAIKEEADRLGAKTEFTLLAEASEYRESERIRAHLTP